MPGHEKNLFYIYFQIIKKYKEYMNTELANFDLTPAEINILTFLINNENKNITASDISIGRGVSKSLVSKAVNSLKNEGIVKTVENPDDGRSVYIEILNNKNDLIKKLRKVNRKFIAKLLQDIDVSDLGLFLKINNKMLNNIKNVNGRPEKCTKKTN